MSFCWAPRLLHVQQDEFAVPCSIPVAEFPGMCCEQRWGEDQGEQLPWAQPTGWIPLLKMSENGVLSPGVQDLIIHHALAYRLSLVYDSLLS